MNDLSNFSSNTIKSICEFFNGDNQNSPYIYRSGTTLADMYNIRFRGCDAIAGPSRWTLCEKAMIFMDEQNKLGEFFNVMLSFKNIKKELKKPDDECIEERRKAIDYISALLYEDDYELHDVSGKIYLSKAEDNSCLLGEGGFAKVYLVPGTNTVMKKLKDEFRGDKNIVSRFKNEYKILSQDLSEVSGIIEVFDINVHELFYTMEYCEIDLQKYIKENSSRLSDDARIELVIDILTIMNAVHEKRVLHRDLSPKNIFIKNDKPIIADFGLGKAIDSNGRTYATCDTSYQGTLEYCDPRQFQGLGFADEQSDIYSLGKIINYIMTGESENFDHDLSIITTIATQTSLAARYHSVSEMLNKIKQIKNIAATGYYAADCASKIEKCQYDSSMDEYLLSYEGEELIIKLYDTNIILAYFNLFTKKEYEAVLIEKLSTTHNRLGNAIGLTFANLDGLGNALINLLRDNRKIGPGLKEMIGKNIYDIAVGVGRWSVQGHLAECYPKIEHIYIDDSVNYLKEHTSLFIK